MEKITYIWQNSWKAATQSYRACKMVASCIFKELPLLCFWVSWFLFLVAGTVHVMMSLEPPQMSRKHLWGFYFCLRCRDALREESKRIKLIWVSAKKLAKKCWHPARRMVLYLSAKRWDKRMTSESQLEVKRKEPIDVRKFRLAPRKRERSKFDGEIRITKNFEKRAWQKITSVIK